MEIHIDTGTAILTVRDWGGGFGQSERRGTGLGLSAVRGISADVWMEHLADTLEEIRRAIVNAQRFTIPETAKSYSPHAIVSVEVAMSSDDDDPPRPSDSGRRSANT